MGGLMCQIKTVEIEGEDAMELKKVVLKNISYYSQFPLIKVYYWCATLRALSNPVFHVNTIIS